MRRSEANRNAAFMRQSGALEEICLAPSFNSSIRGSGSPDAIPNPGLRLKSHGVFNRKKRAGSAGLIGMAFENAPLPLNKPVLFVVQVAAGAATFVEVSHA